MLIAADQEDILLAVVQEGVLIAADQDGVLIAADQEDILLAVDQEGVLLAEDLDGVLFCLCVLLSIGWFLKNLVGVLHNLLGCLDDDTDRTCWDSGSTPRVPKYSRAVRGIDVQEVGVDIGVWGDVAREVEWLHKLGFSCTVVSCKTKTTNKEIASAMLPYLFDPSPSIYPILPYPYVDEMI